MASDDILDSNNLELGFQQLCVRESTSDDFVPHVVLLAEQLERLFNWAHVDNNIIRLLVSIPRLREAETQVR